MQIFASPVTLFTLTFYHLIFRVWPYLFAVFYLNCARLLHLFEAITPIWMHRPVNDVRAELFRFFISFSFTRTLSNLVLFCFILLLYFPLFIAWHVSVSLERFMLIFIFLVAFVLAISKTPNIKTHYTDYTMYITSHQYSQYANNRQRSANSLFICNNIAKCLLL